MNNMFDLGAAASICARYVVAEYNHLCRRQAMVFSAIEMIVSAIAYRILQDKDSKPSTDAGFYISRVIGFAAAAGITYGLGYVLDPLAVIAMTVSGIAIGLLALSTSAAKDPLAAATIIV